MSEASRIIHCGDGIAFLATALPADHAVITSLPDHSELPHLGVDRWRSWFVDCAARVCSAVAAESVAIFYQTDVKHDGRWIDKSHLVQLGAEAAGSHLLWHKIVCRVAPNTTTFGRPAYAHMLCLSRARRLRPGESSADVLPALGDMPWSRAMGTAACEAAVHFVSALGIRTVVDPFCGLGTVLAVANRHGLAAIGVEQSRRRAAKARKLVY